MLRRFHSNARPASEEHMKAREIFPNRPLSNTHPVFLRSDFPVITRSGDIACAAVPAG
jgi:hypothetical protein